MAKTEFNEKTNPLIPSRTIDFCAINEILAVNILNGQIVQSSYALRPCVDQNENWPLC